MFLIIPHSHHVFILTVYESLLHVANCSIVCVILSLSRINYSLSDNVSKYCQKNTEYWTKPGVKTGLKSAGCVWQDYITVCVCVCVRPGGIHFSGEPVCPLCHGCHCDYIEGSGLCRWWRGRDPGVGVPTAHCGSALHVWAVLQAKHGHSAVSCDTVAAKLPECVCVCVRHEWHAILVFDWLVWYQLNFHLGRIWWHHRRTLNRKPVPKCKRFRGTLLWPTSFGTEQFWAIPIHFEATAVLFLVFCISFNFPFKFISF